MDMNQNNPGASALISVIVPVYNAALYFEKCVNSILGQTYRNLEIFLCDDGSTDESLNMCNEFAARDSRIHVLHHENMGPAATRNDAIDRATGDFIMFVDSDDYIHPEMAERLYEGVCSERVKMSVCGLIFETGGGTKPFPSQHVNWIKTSEHVKEMLLAGKEIKGWLCNKLFDRAMIGAMRLKEDLHYCEDLEFILRLLDQEEPFLVSHIPYYGYFYNYHMGSLSRTNNISKLISIRRFRAYMDAYKKCGIPVKSRILKDASKELVIIRSLEMPAQEKKQLEKESLSAIKENLAGVRGLPVKETVKIMLRVMKLQ